MMGRTANWPDPGNDVEKNRELFKAKLEWHKKSLEAEVAREVAHNAYINAKETAEFANYYATRQEFYKGYIEVSKETAKESISRADFIQKIAAAIGGLYTGMLAFMFSVSKDVAADVVALDIRGIAPTIFLGLAFFLAAAYIGFITHPNPILPARSGGTLGDAQRAMRDTFIIWTRASLLRRRYLLQASVVSMGIGIAFLPAPFLEINNDLLWYLVAAGLAVVIIIPLFVYYFTERRRDLEENS